MDAETVYIFRHALMSGAAYDLQPPGERAILHALALDILESALHGHPGLLRGAALELAHHARQAQVQRRTANLKALKTLAEKECLYLVQGAQLAFDQFDFLAANRAADTLAMHPAATPAQASMALVCLGEVARQQGRNVQARGYFERAASVSDQSGLAEQHAKALRGLGIVMQRTPDSEAGVGLVRKAMLILEQLGLKRAAATCRADLATLQVSQGNATEAIAAYVQSIAEQRLLNESDQLAVTLLSLADVLIRVRRLDEARQAVEEAESITSVTSNLPRKAGCAMAWARIFKQQGRRVEAAQMARKSEQIRRALGDEPAALSSILFAAILTAEDGDTAGAIAVARQGLALSLELGDPFWHASLQLNLGAWLDQTGKYPESESASRQAVAVLEDVGEYRGAAVALSNLASALKAQGRQAEAIGCYRRALPALERQGDPVALGVALGGLAEALCMERDPGANAAYDHSCRILGEAQAKSELEDIRQRWQRALQARGRV